MSINPSDSMDETARHLFYMHYALALAEKGRYSAPPNPWVGCVIVKNDRIVGQGYHERPGLDHAESVALKQAGYLAEGATVYVTLEPCAHTGRTAPCVDALIQAKVKKVVIPFDDPDPRVKGLGRKKLQDAGIEVLAGVASHEAAECLAPYLHHRKTGRPYVVLKVASSIDGKVATKNGQSRWITSKEAREDAHKIRAGSQAILIGSQTALVDSPKLTVRAEGLEGCRPHRLVWDRRARLRPEGPLFDVSLGPVTLLSSLDNPQKSAFEAKGVKVQCIPGLSELLLQLGQAGVLQLLIEGGPTLSAAFLAEGLVNKCHLYLGNCIIGPEGRSAFMWPHPQSMDQIARWGLKNVYKLADTLRCDYQVI
jgi:diaminohydroxyphosphoribosylaminopyrimidine deaminase/5-amino-6-(5-phosphoribosylamino)uracil reductase